MPRQPAESPVVCPSEDLPELGQRRFRIDRRGESEDAILVRIQGIPYAFVNRCVHMGKPLDSEDDELFDDTGRYIRCTVHGVLYRPDTGEALASICAGKSLIPVRIEERDGAILLTEPRSRLVD